jgi:chromosome segregation ATPase
MDNTSQNSSHHYAALLHTVSDLRTDLEKTTSKIKVLEEQNYLLSNNYAVVKDELIETRKKYNEAKESYLSAVSEKFDMERKHEQFVERLKIQLAERTREFEQIRDKLVPHDIDQLRIKVQEELEIQHKQELKVLENEIDDQREKFFLLKREFERSKAEYNSLIQNQQQEIFALRTEKESMEENARKELQTGMNEQPHPLKDDKLRHQAAKASEFSHLVEKLREEAIQLRKEKDQAVYALEEYKSKHDQAINNIKTKNALLESERAGYQERISRLELDVEKKEAQNRNMKLNLEELTEQVDQAVKFQQELQRQISTLRSDHITETDLLRETHYEEVKELNESISSSETKVSEREDQLRRLQREITDLQIRTENSDNEIRRSYNAQIQELRKKYSTIEIECLEAKQNTRLLDEQISILQEQSVLEKDSLHSEISRIKKEKEILLSKIRELDNNLENSRKKFLSVQTDHFNKNNYLEKKIRDLNATVINLENKNEALINRNNDIEKDKMNLQESLHKMEKTNKELNNRVENVRKDFQSELESLQPAFQRRAEELKNELKNSLAKERKRADAYKTKALEANAKIQSLVGSRDF